MRKWVKWASASDPGLPRERRDARGETADAETGESPSRERRRGCVSCVAAFLAVCVAFSQAQGAAHYVIICETVSFTRRYSELRDARDDSSLFLSTKAVLTSHLRLSCLDPTTSTPPIQHGLSCSKHTRRSRPEYVATTLAEVDVSKLPMFGLEHLYADGRPRPAGSAFVSKSCAFHWPSSRR